MCSKISHQSSIQLCCIYVIYRRLCCVSAFAPCFNAIPLAVGYEARKFGISRMLRGDEAKEKCPDLILFHVPEKRGKADLTWLELRWVILCMRLFVPMHARMHTLAHRLGQIFKSNFEASNGIGIGASKLCYHWSCTKPMVMLVNQTRLQTIRLSPNTRT